MSEYELQQLIMASRVTIDQLVLLAFAVNFALVVVAIWQRHSLSKVNVRWLKLMCFGISTFIVLQAAAGLLQLYDLSQILDQSAHRFNSQIPLIDWPVMILRAVLLFGFPLVSLHFLNQAVKPYDK